MSFENIQPEMDLPDFSRMNLEDVERDLIQSIISQQAEANRHKLTDRILGLIQLHYGPEEAARFQSILNKFV